MDLRSKVIKARSKLLKIEPEYEEVKERYNKAMLEWKNLAIELEEADYLQAQLDGRTKTYPKGQKKPKPLTLSQIESIAERLGINLNLTGEEDEEGI